MDAVEKVARVICKFSVDCYRHDGVCEGCRDEAQAALSAIHFAEMQAVVNAAWDAWPVLDRYAPGEDHEKVTDALFAALTALDARLKPTPPEKP